MTGYVQVQTGSLYSEEDLLRRAAAKRWNGSKGFDKRVYNKVMNTGGKQLADSAAGPAVTADYYYGMNGGSSMGGAMPGPADAAKPPAEDSYGKQVEERRDTISNIAKDVYTAAVIGIKDSIYKYITEGPILFINKAIQWVNRRGKWADRLSSLGEMGLYSGAVEVRQDDWKDTLDMYLERDTKTVLGFRRWTDRDPKKWYVQFLKKESMEKGDKPIPRAGREMRIEDLEFNEKGQIARIREDSDAGGILVRPDNIGYDSKFYTDSGVEKFITHGEKADFSTFRNNIVQYTIAHYANHGGSAKDYVLGQSPTGKTVICRRFPKSLSEIDPHLIFDTLGTALGIRGAHYLYKWFNQDQAEADMMFSSYFVRYSIGY